MSMHCSRFSTSTGLCSSRSLRSAHFFFCGGFSSYARQNWLHRSSFSLSTDMMRLLLLYRTGMVKYVTLEDMRPFRLKTKDMNWVWFAPKSRVDSIPWSWRQKRIVEEFNENVCTLKLWHDGTFSPWSTRCVHRTFYTQLHEAEWRPHVLIGAYHRSNAYDKKLLWDRSMSLKRDCYLLMLVDSLCLSPKLNVGYSGGSSCQVCKTFQHDMNNLNSWSFELFVLTRALGCNDDPLSALTNLNLY
jgi:hypothetical protein